MDLTEKEVFLETIQKLNDLEESEDLEFGVEAKILEEMTGKLPKGEIKIFFTDLVASAKEAQEIYSEHEEGYEADLKKAKKILEGMKKKLRKGVVPKEVPMEIVKACREAIEEAIMGVEFSDMF
ncbi:MAG: hypothetical protein KJ674_05795 [Nanoarchaeota archaeon]|nr:hypothetical protein [Patescibacteria group bacterium]MBU2634722.1 hypothetical protein [Nanoarchaeota archaeon]